MVQNLRKNNPGSLLGRSQKKGPRRPRTKAETEKRRRIFIVILIVVAVVASLATVGYGYYDTSVKPWRQPILRVNGTVFNMRYFVTAMRWNSATTAEYADYVISIMEENELKKQYLANEFGISIDAAAIDEELRNQLTEAFVGQGILSENATEEEYEKAYREWRDSYTKQSGLSVQDIKNLAIQPELVNKALTEQVGNRDYPSTDNYDQARVQALLITSADNASLMRTRWENGADFDTLAAEAWVSTSIRDTESDNTTPKWVSKGIQSDTFDNYTFTMPLGMLGDPVQDGEGSENYWLIDVLAREARQLSESDRDTLVTDDLQKWLDDAKTSPENLIVNYLNEAGGKAKLDYAIEHVQVDTG